MTNLMPPLKYPKPPQVISRISWVDVAKWMCILYVINSHLDSRAGWLFKMYEPVFLTGFFFLSGYVDKGNLTFGKHMIKKIRGLLIPWLVFSTFDTLLSSMFTLKSYERNFWSEMGWNLLQIRGKGDGLWFIAALFIAYIPFWWIIRRTPVKAITVTATLSVCSMLYSHLMNPDILPWGSASLPWHLEYVFQANLWMVLGYYCRQYGEQYFSKFDNTPYLIGIAAAYLLCVYLPVSDTSLWIIPISYARTLLGLPLLIMLCKRIHPNRYILFVGANTLTYFALHGKVIAVVQVVLDKLMPTVYELILGNAVASGLLSIVITLATSVILIIPAYIIDRWMPWLLGRRKARP